MKNQDTNVRELFRTHGLRITLLRIQVYKVILELSGKEFCVQDICEKLNTRDIFLSQASVSRVIKQFEEAGLISKNKGQVFDFFNTGKPRAPVEVELKQVR